MKQLIRLIKQIFYRLKPLSKSAQALKDACGIEKW